MTDFLAPAQDLEGQVAVITGASRGIGQSIGIKLALRGCSILGTCSKPESLGSFDVMRAIIKDLRQRMGLKTEPEVPVHGIVADIFSSDCATVIADAVAQRYNGRLNIFINNAADARDAELGALTTESIQQSMTANIQTPVLIVEEFVKRKMFRENSRIIYISSIRSRQPWSGQLMYSATKSAGESLCRTWAEAFGGKNETYAYMDGTTANAVTVGLTATDSVMNCGPELVDIFQKEFIPRQSIPRFGQPDDVSDVVSLLCSYEARWITGSVISASGGGIKMM